MPTQWTNEDQETALAQGWGIFNRDSDPDIPEIQRHDAAGVFTNDEEAERFVESRARQLQPLAMKALLYLGEKRSMTTWCVFCMKNAGVLNKAVALAPQTDLEARLPFEGIISFIWRPACKDHIAGWWDGSDVPEKRRPRIVFVGDL